MWNIEALPIFGSRVQNSESDSSFISSTFSTFQLSIDLGNIAIGLLNSEQHVRFKQINVKYNLYQSRANASALTYFTPLNCTWTKRETWAKKGATLGSDVYVTKGIYGKCYKCTKGAKDAYCWLSVLNRQHITKLDY
jgi:hypothetical protein